MSRDKTDTEKRLEATQAQLDVQINKMKKADKELEDTNKLLYDPSKITTPSMADQLLGAGGSNGGAVSNWARSLLRRI